MERMHREQQQQQAEIIRRLTLMAPPAPVMQPAFSMQSVMQPMIQPAFQMQPAQIQPSPSMPPLIPPSPVPRLSRPRSFPYAVPSRPVPPIENLYIQPNNQEGLPLSASTPLTSNTGPAPGIAAVVSLPVPDADHVIEISDSEEEKVSRNDSSLAQTHSLPHRSQSSSLNCQNQR